MGLSARTNLIQPQFDRNEDHEQHHEPFEKARRVVDFLPRNKQGEFNIDEFIRYDDMLFFDPKRDGLYRCPHIFVEFTHIDGPFAGSIGYLTVSKEQINIDDWRRIDYFASATTIEPRAPRNDVTIMLDPETVKKHFEYGDDAETLFAVDERYGALNQGTSFK